MPLPLAALAGPAVATGGRVALSALMRHLARRALAKGLTQQTAKGLSRRAISRYGPDAPAFFGRFGLTKAGLGAVGSAAGLGSFLPIGGLFNAPQNPAQLQQNRISAPRNELMYYGSGRKQQAQSPQMSEDDMLALMQQLSLMNQLGGQ